MNELIEQFAEESGLATWDENKIATEAFAEMIIKECINQIQEAIPDTWCAASPAYRTAKIAAIACIQHKFGMGL